MNYSYIFRLSQISNNTARRAFAVQEALCLLVKVKKRRNKLLKFLVHYVSFPDVFGGL
jgi:hypothetical protein